MLERFLLVWLVLSSLAAFYWPGLQEHLPFLGDPFVGSKPLLPWLIGVTMFAIGMMLPRDEVRQVLRRWPTVLSGTAVQYTAMPLLAFSMAKLWGLEGDYLIGVVMVGCVPGAMASNVLTLNARGNTSYSVSLTTAATLLSPLAVPLVLGLALSGESIKQSVLYKSSLDLFVTVVIPVILGHLSSIRFPHLQRRAKQVGSIIANLVILWIIAAVVGLQRESLNQFRFDLLWVLLCVNIGGYLIGYFSGTAIRLPQSMRRALTLEVGMQNAGLGAMLATKLFDNAPEHSAVAIAPAMYTFGCMLTGTVLARAWAAWGRAEEASESKDSNR